MQYAYATCILNETGAEINETNLTAVLEAAGCSVQESRVKAIVAALEDIDVEDVTTIELEDTDERTAIAADQNGHSPPADDSSVEMQSEPPRDPSGDVDTERDVQPGSETQPVPDGFETPTSLKPDDER